MQIGQIGEIDWPQNGVPGSVRRRGMPFGYPRPPARKMLIGAPRPVSAAPRGHIPNRAGDRPLGAGPEPGQTWADRARPWGSEAAQSVISQRMAGAAPARSGGQGSSEAEG